MIKDNQTNFNRLHIVGDGIIVAGSYMLAWYIKFESVFSNVKPEDGVLPMATYFSALYFLVPAYLILYSILNLYTPQRATKMRYELYNIISANVLGLIGFTVVLYLIKQTHFSRSMIGYFFFINIFFTSLSRILLRRFFLFHLSIL